MNVMLLSVVVAFASPGEVTQAAPLAASCVEFQDNPVAAAQAYLTVRGKGDTKDEAKSDAQRQAGKASGGKYSAVSETYSQDGDKWICAMMIFYTR